MGRKYYFFKIKFSIWMIMLIALMKCCWKVWCQSIVTTWQCEIITAKYRQQQYKTFRGVHQSFFSESTTPSIVHMYKAILESDNSLYTLQIWRPLIHYLGILVYVDIFDISTPLIRGSKRTNKNNQITNVDNAE